MNQYIEQIRRGAKYSLHYDPFGNPMSVSIFDAELTNSIPIGNDNFETLLEYIDSIGRRPIPQIEWCQTIKNNKGEALYYHTNSGNFVTGFGSEIELTITAGLESGAISSTESRLMPPVSNATIYVFLPRNFSLSGIPMMPIRRHTFPAGYLGTPFQCRISLLKEIDDSFFWDGEILREILNNINGNVIEIDVSGKHIESLYKFAISHLDDQTRALLERLKAENLALNKRSKSRGPTTGWYFEGIVLQQYIWAPVLEVANQIIDLINRQASKKNVSLLSKDDLGDLCCVRVITTTGSSHLWPISSLLDAQITLFPEQLNWQHDLIERSLFRVAYLVDRSLYFEAIVVAQAFLEAVVNGMFDDEILRAACGRPDVKWAQKYKLLKSFFGNQLHFDGALFRYLDFGIRRIYEIRNDYCHDIFAHEPNYDFTVGQMKEIEDLLRPMTTAWDRSLFLPEISRMYSMRPDFLRWLLAQEQQTILSSST